jgi:ferritin-like metal-binding protein YciE
MAEVCAANVRDAALVASLQRLTHYRIAAYASVVAFARSLGRTEEVALLARYLEHDKTFDAELTALAESILNPKATAQPQDTATGEVRPH